MIDKETIKREIEQLANNKLELLYQYLTSLKRSKKGNLNIRSFHLKGKLDQQNLRAKALKK